MPTPTVTIPKQEYDELLNAKAFFDKARDLFAKKGSSFTARDLENLPTEDARQYEPSFLEGLRESQKELEEGKGERVHSLMDLA